MLTGEEKNEKENEKSSKVNFTIAFCTFRDIVPLHLGLF